MLGILYASLTTSLATDATSRVATSHNVYKHKNTSIMASGAV